jgi:hypothetical protein
VILVRKTKLHESGKSRFFKKFYRTLV